MVVVAFSVTVNTIVPLSSVSTVSLLPRFGGWNLGSCASEARICVLRLRRSFNTAPREMQQQFGAHLHRHAEGQQRAKVLRLLTF